MKQRLVIAGLAIAALSMTLIPAAVGRTVYSRTVSLDVRLVEGELIATGRVRTAKPAGYNCIQRVPVYIRTHASGASEWSSTGDLHAKTDQYGRFRIELPLDSSWAQYKAVVGRQKYREVRKACARAVSPTTAWPTMPIRLQDPIAGDTLGSETTFRIGVGNPEGVESVGFKIYPEGTRDACPRHEQDSRDYEAPYEWTWEPTSVSGDVVLGVAAWGRDGFAKCAQWGFDMGELGSLMWWGVSPEDPRSSLGSSSTFFKTEKGLIPVAGYFDSDDFADVFWYSETGEEEIWWGSRGSFQEAPSQSRLEGGLSPTVGDFDNNGLDDIIWYGVGSRADMIWWGAPGRTWDISNQPQITGVWDQLVAGDYNGDGYDDVFFYANNAKTKDCANTQPQTYWWGKNDRAALSSGATSGLGSECHYRFLAGDFDGNTFDDFLAYGVGLNTRDTLTWRNPAASAKSPQQSGFSPFLGDFNGDQKDDVFWFAPGAPDEQWWGPSRPAAGSTTFVPDETALSMDGDVEPIAADFDGDGDDDILWYKR